MMAMAALSIINVPAGEIMKTTILLAVIVATAVGCASKPEPRTIWVAGQPVKENCLFVEEQWSRVLPAIGSPNIASHTVHTSAGSIAAARVGDQTYVCNRSEYEMKQKR